MGDPIRLERNPDWVDKKTRPTCKYAPVLVPKDQSNGAILYMKYVLKRVLTTSNRKPPLRTDAF
jgi:hypothetical protein